MGLAELLLSGCTTVFDHTYLYQNGNSVDVQVEAAREIGVRFHASRGSMSVGRSKGGLPPDEAVEDEAFILKDSERVIDRYHDPRPGAMTRVVLAPCAPFSVSADLLRESAALARARGVRLHTHLAETRDEERYTLERFGVRPVEWMDRLGWVAGDVWFAHAVHVSEEEIGRFARAGCGVAHCPSSNMRLASGIAPVKEYLRQGVAVGLAVDGSASNDASNMLLEARQAMLLARLELGLRKEGKGLPAEWMSAREALGLATLGGARVLGRDDVGSLEAGKCADFFSLDLAAVEYAGALHDPVAATLFCAPTRARTTVVHGRVVVDEGRLATVDLCAVVARHNRLAAGAWGGPYFSSMTWRSRRREKMSSTSSSGIGHSLRSERHVPGAVDAGEHEALLGVEVLLREGHRGQAQDRHRARAGSSSPSSRSAATPPPRGGPSSRPG